MARGLAVSDEFESEGAVAVDIDALTAFENILPRGDLRYLLLINCI
jgi:hypothetical protein